MSRRAFSLDAVPPFRLDLTVWALHRRTDNCIDRWDGQAYRRVLEVTGAPLEVAVTQPGGPDDARLQVVVAGGRVPREAQPRVTAALERLLGLRVDLAGFYRLAAGDTRLAPPAERFRGLKPPRFPTIFEALVNAIACQQITLTLGIRLLGGLAAAYGVAARGDQAAAHAFPRPDALAQLPPEALRPLRFSHQKARPGHAGGCGL